MSKITQKFQNNKSLIAYLVAGDPSIEKTGDYIIAMHKAGVDLIEIGIPFSDPSADGPVNQRGMIRALQNGITVEKLFTMVKRVRAAGVDIPLLFMSYCNPIFHFGYDKFFAKCQESGIDGVIIPDVPYEELKEYSDYANNYGIEYITLIAPTSSERVEILAKQAKGFIYLISSLGVTGARTKINNNINDLAKKIKEFTDIPVAIGFGISTPEQAREMTRTADGCVIGSAIVKIIEEYKENADEKLFEFVFNVKKMMN
ncbi:MAG: tryptophan synthase subunit alpha [Mycoplasmataceae bacterium]|jgi:tryptophan synthase alpha chain|nr:tryptophan synthase subunit alpha [Mycoplasmataceae bacterium]